MYLLENSILKKTLILIWVIYILSAIVIYFAGGEQFFYSTADTGEMVKATNDVGEMTTGREICQRFKLNGSEISSIIFEGYNYQQQVGGIMNISLTAEDGRELYSREYDMTLLGNVSPTEIILDKPVPILDDEIITLKIKVIDGSKGSSPTIYYGSSIYLARGEIPVNLKGYEKLYVDGKVVDGKLCFKAVGKRDISFGRYYWYIFAGISVLLLFFTIFELQSRKREKRTRFCDLINAIVKYKYLLGQLVQRDFKRKYKRSVLGVLWSLLNPMLIMMVQYVVFSTIFKSDISNFAVYLLSGIVCYNFFSEITNMSLTSIVENASLITKVYIPKSIYPISRAFSATINFMLSLIPLLIVILVTKTPITHSIAVLPFAIICLFVLSLGVGLILSSLMVFFRDTQFLWNVFILIWMYVTPIFYPEKILSGWIQYVFKINPLYHIIRFFRIVLLNGISPEPKAYLYCLVASVVPLIIGIMVFYKSKDKFILYL